MSTGFVLLLVLGIIVAWIAMKVDDIRSFDRQKEQWRADKREYAEWSKTHPDDE